MLDIVLSVSVLAAVVFFGALISIGNERQRKAIDGIREQAALWAIQDLRLKREKLARELMVDDPLAWLNKVAAGVLGENPCLSVIGVAESPAALICHDGSGRFVVFSPASPSEIRRMIRERRSRLSRLASHHPLLPLPRGALSYELSILNSGILFDLEILIVWKALSDGQELSADRLWMYMLPAAKSK